MLVQGLHFESNCARQINFCFWDIKKKNLNSSSKSTCLDVYEYCAYWVEFCSVALLKYFIHIYIYIIHIIYIIYLAFWKIFKKFKLKLYNFPEFCILHTPKYWESHFRFSKYKQIPLLNSHIPLLTKNKFNFACKLSFLSWEMKRAKFGIIF